MALPFDFNFVCGLAKCSTLTAYEKLIDNASLEQLYSVVSILNKHSQCPVHYYSWWSVRNAHIKSDLRRDYNKIRRAVCAALIIDFTVELTKCVEHENL